MPSSTFIVTLFSFVERSSFIMALSFAAAVPFNRSSFKRDALEPRHFKGDISRSGGEVVAVVTAAVAQAPLITFMLSSICKTYCTLCYMKENNVKVKDETDVNSIMRDMMSIILKGVLY